MDRQAFKLIIDSIVKAPWEWKLNLTDWFERGTKSNKIEIRLGYDLWHASLYKPFKDDFSFFQKLRFNRTLRRWKGIETQRLISQETIE